MQWIEKLLKRQVITINMKENKLEKRNSLRCLYFNSNKIQFKKFNKIQQEIVGDYRKK